MSDFKLSKDLLGYSYEYLYPSVSSEKKDVSKNLMNRFDEAYSSQKNRYSTSPNQYYIEESIFEESLPTNSSQADKNLTTVNGGHGFVNYIPKEEAKKASKTKEKSVEKLNELTAENSVEKSNESPKDKAMENSVKEQKEVKPAEKAEKPPKSKTKSTKKGKQSKFFKGKKAKFGAILAGIALVGAAIAYVEDKASDKVDKAGNKVDKAKDVKAEKPVENTTQIEEAPETVEPIQVAPENVPVQEEIDPDVVTVKSGDTVWDLCEQKLKEWGNENPTAKQIRELVDKVMPDEKNHLYLENDNYTVIIKPEQKIWICKPEEENL